MLQLAIHKANEVAGRRALAMDGGSELGELARVHGEAAPVAQVLERVVDVLDNELCTTRPLGR